MSALSHASTRLELVAVVADRRLDVYIDDYATNAPLAALDVRLQGPRGSTTLSEREPGLYSTPLEPELRSAPISLQVRGADWLETVNGTLELAAEAPAAHSGRGVEAWALAVVVALLIGSLGAFALWRRR